MSYLKERNIVDKWVYLLVHQNNGNKLEIVPPYQPIVTNFFDDNREENRYFIHYNNEQREIYKPFDTEIGATKSLLRKVFEKKVKTVYIALDDDAKKDAYRLSEFFKDFGIDSKVVNLPVDKDPNDLGWERITALIDTTESASFSDSIQAKLYG